MQVEEVKHVSGNEYELGTTPGTTMWVTVGKMSVCIQKTDEGVLCDIYTKGKEDEGEITSCYAFDDEAENDE